MALIKFGAGIAEMRGSIAGTTFSRNKSGAYARNRTKPVNPNTTHQVIVRAAMAELTVRWSQTLTLAQRTAWNLYASNVAMKNKLGEAIRLSGFNHYIRSNSWLAVMGGTFVDAGPTTFELPAHDPGFSIAASEAAQEITATYDDTMDWANETDSYLIFYQGQPQNPQRNFFKGPWRRWWHIAGITGAPPASPQATGVTLAIAELQRQWVYARILRADGRLSEQFEADCFVAA